MARILVIDDNETMREGMAYTIRKMGHEVDVAEGGRRGLMLYRPGVTDFVVTDLKMDDIGGLEVLKSVRERDPEALVLVVTAFGTVEVAVEAMKAGAYDFITKPFSMEMLRVKVEKGLTARSLKSANDRLTEENQILRDELAPPTKEQDILGESDQMKRVFKMIRKVSQSESTVHVFGESGTGKELVARAIHEQSPRKDGPFIKVNCGALAENLLESELFGHEKGAFTNAIKRRLGRFELADGGTLFLDEIGEISPATQVKLLRVLQEKEFERVGGERPIKVDVRIVSATNRDLQKEVEAGRFREDLFYRLHILPLTLPPLRDRLDDLEILVHHFLKKLRLRTRHEVKGVEPDFLEALRKYSWPGNVRELENVMEQTLVFADEETLRKEDLPLHISKATPRSFEHQDGVFSMLGTRTLPQLLDDLEKQLIQAAFSQAGGVKTETARTLGIKTSALYYKLEKYNIESK